MGLELFEHNKTAYVSALNLMKKTGKAAVVHPTGTGKSFIAFKLSEDNKDKKICWLAPSEYIFKTQLENLIRVSGGYVPENIVFFTYSRLMNMQKNEMLAVNPDYIVLDEFHRCGARQWGNGVNKFLNLHKTASVLGLTATDVRYLDGQRNMSSELFDGNIASYMTLGEAVVRGILNPPKYVMAVFSYQKELEKTENRIKSAKNIAVRNECERYLEQLRRILQNADGTEELFKKHLTDKSGKYIVFCSSYEHLREMIKVSKEWFKEIDESPHVYAAYSSDPETSNEFENFKADKSPHLKLLYCIDMLNEGVHVEGLSGVILLRPTVSPIVYKQQIGRALSSGENKTPVIFDIVMNIENLCSVGELKDEMQIASAYYRQNGESEKIINGQFKIIGELHDCITLFKKLNDTLSSSWNLMYEKAKEYFNTYGNLEIKKRYVCPDGSPLGAWLNTQRMVYSGKATGVLTDIQIEKLSEIGMRWKNASELKWQKNLEAAKRYFEEHGNLNVPVSDREYFGVKLGRWLNRLRLEKKTLSEEQIKSLDEIGMVWNAKDKTFETFYKSARLYYKLHKNLDVPIKYTDTYGVRLGAWLNSLRQKGKKSLDPEQVKALDGIEINWEGNKRISWNESFNAAKKYAAQFGHLNIPPDYVSPEGLTLGLWLKNQRKAFDSTMSEDRRKKLLNIGFIPETADPWDRKMRLVEEYFEKFGNVSIPNNYVVSGTWLARWLSNQVRRLNETDLTEKRLSEEQIKRLEAVGIKKGVSKSDAAWDKQYEAAKLFYEINGHLNIPKKYCTPSGKHLGAWLVNQRSYKKKGILDKNRVNQLNKIGMIWN